MRLLYQCLQIVLRDCLFHDEGDLKLFKYYTTSNCMLECANLARLDLRHTSLRSVGGNLLKCENLPEVILPVSLTEVRGGFVGECAKAGEEKG